MFFFLIWIFLSIGVELTIVRNQNEDKSPFVIYSSNEQVKNFRFQLIPSVGFVRPDEKETVVLNLTGWIYQPIVQRQKSQTFPIEELRNPFSLMNFIKEFRLIEKLTEEKRVERLFPFFVLRRPNFSIKIILTDSIRRTISTNNEGQFQVQFSFDSSTNLPIKNDVLNYIATDDNAVSYRGTIYLLQKQDEKAVCSIISTIDDTIKLSDTFDSIKWLKSSFENDFEAIPGTKRMS